MFVRVPRDYYEQDLDFRRQCLSAASVQHLCKSIVMENTRAPHDFVECGGFANSKFYCVIIQVLQTAPLSSHCKAERYANRLLFAVQYAARLHAEKLKRYLAKLNSKLGSKNFNMRLAPSEISDRLTSYTHNAVRVAQSCFNTVMHGHLAKPSACAGHAHLHGNTTANNHVPLH